MLSVDDRFPPWNYSPKHWRHATPRAASCRLTRRAALVAQAAETAQAAKESETYKVLQRQGYGLLLAHVHVSCMSRRCALCVRLLAQVLCMSCFLCAGLVVAARRHTAMTRARCRGLP